MLNWLRYLTDPPSLHLLPPGAAAAQRPPAVPATGWLLPALDRAGLRALTAAPQPLTLLAPTDAGLQAAGLVPAALEADTLQHWLLHHLTLADVAHESVLPMLDGSLVRRGPDSGLWVDAAGDAVAMAGPAQACGTLRVQPIARPLGAATAGLWTCIAAEPGLARFADALERTGLAPLLDCAGPFTVFAPSDAGMDRAAARLGLGRAALWQDTPALAALLCRHILPGRWSSAQLPWGSELRTWGDAPLALTPLGRLRSGDLTQPLAAGSDQPCRNGVLHRVHEALLPPPG